MHAEKPNPNIDRLAAALAASAGIVWERLDHYPGYLRGIWRGEASRLLAGMECKPRRPA